MAEVHFGFIKGSEERLLDIIVGSFGVVFDEMQYSRDPEGYSSKLAHAYQQVLALSGRTLESYKLLLQSIEKQRTDLEGKLDPKPGFVHKAKDRLKSLSGHNEHDKKISQLQEALSRDKMNSDTFSRIIGFSESERNRFEVEKLREGISGKTLEGLDACIKLVEGVMQNYASALQLAQRAQELQNGLYQSIKEHTGGYYIRG